jgi:hypothetical protein
MNRDVNNDVSQDPLFFVQDGPTRFGPRKRPKAPKRLATAKFGLGDLIRHRGVPGQPTGRVTEVYMTGGRVLYAIQVDGWTLVVAQQHAERA